MLSSIELSRVLISQATSKGISVCNLKLQKLLYYIQGYHLACTGTPFFLDSIEAWRHGPVIGTVYHAYKALWLPSNTCYFFGSRYCS
ncbi:Panacea domain-containing protein [Microbulbifer epialgicus]|uniref:Panacea domain-containing protein n=1 Tax=Microbulbifer epialgicus TaxID=393907 RepID=A0ABV4P5J8_9GAMM